MLDEAHAVGVIGPHGRGLAAEENLSDDVDVQMGTMSKALGTSGGYICGSHDLIEWLINRARSFVYSTAPPAGNRCSRTGCCEFSFIFRRRTTKASALGQNQIDEGAFCHWTLGVGRWALDV